MFIAPATAPGPSKGRPASAATLLRAPSPPTRYFDRTVYSAPVSRSLTRLVTPPSSWVWLRYSVSKRILAPRSCAPLTRIGSVMVCGASSMVHGLCSS